MCRIILAGLFVSMATLSHAGPLAKESLPVGDHPRALDTPHFPNRLHAFVWRNWQLVEPDRIAKVVGTSSKNIVDIAMSMGLPATVKVPSGMRQRGYITIIRRNWHLLPYDQLLTLLGMSSKQLAHSLREDDFLFIKLGSLKPECEPLRYQPPDSASRKRAEQIRRIVQTHFGKQLETPAQPRFDFVRQLSRMEEQRPKRGTEPGKSAGGLRFIYSYFGIYGDPLSDPTLDPYPDGLLARLADMGVNGVWLHVVLRQLAPGGRHFPEFGDGHETRLANLKKLTERAKRHGIGVYLYMNEPRAMPNTFFANRPEMAGVREGEFAAMCTGNPLVKQWLSDSLAHVFREVPELAGLFTITASENLTHCASHGRHQQCPRCQNRTAAEIIVEVNTVIAEGVHRGNPKARVIAWDWGWNGHGDASDIILGLPKTVELMSVSEWAMPFERGGVRGKVGEYSISAVGPGPRAKRHWAVAQQAGLKTVAKVQFNNTWELSAVPFLPVLDLIAEHCERLASAGVDDMMLSWTLGGYPSPNLRVAQRFSTQPGADKDSVLEAISRERYGAAAAPHVRRAWTACSNAFRQFPYHGSVMYRAPQQMGPANLLYGKPTGYRATMVGIPYDDVKGWCGPYPPTVLAQQFEKVATGWAEGVEHLQRALRHVSADKRDTLAADLRVAQAAQIHFASVANQTRFILARDALQSGTLTEESRKTFRAEMVRLLEDEVELARKLFTLTRQDSRIGFEASNHYYYVPLDLVEKVINCQFIRQQYAVAN